MLSLPPIAVAASAMPGRWQGPISRSGDPCRRCHSARRLSWSTAVAVASALAAPSVRHVLSRFVGRRSARRQSIALRQLGLTLLRSEGESSTGRSPSEIDVAQADDDGVKPEKPEISRYQRVENLLWEAWRNSERPRPPLKEVLETLAFHKACQKLLGSKALVIDAAGGHGAIALAFRAFGGAERAVVADLYQPRSFANLRAAWMPEDEDTERAVRHERIDISCPGWLKSLLEREGVHAEATAVVAAHACGGLSDELIRECTALSVEFAIMPCCHKKESGRRRDMLRHAVKLLDIPYSVVLDIARLGVIDACPGYKASLRMIDKAISPMNRMLIGTRETSPQTEARADSRRNYVDKLAGKFRTIFSTSRGKHQELQEDSADS
ncbi:unnamed protein product [Polarella glacialis]|uniref:Methyltransferase domain-containing protein n=1 Tax=Polarella glacialis TaxID=89957 RepID=A0A813JJY9_POLGL|nr:unnamed protein product [Polarella glacialis]